VAVLPRLGVDLVGLVKVIVKSRGELPAALIAQATCRRAIVLDLIKEGKARGHKDFAKITLADAERRALRLPVDGCMPELVYHGDSDGGLSEILNQKAATPQKINEEAKDAFTDHRPNIISLQRSTYQEHDDSTVKANAWDALAQRLCNVLSQPCITSAFAEITRMLLARCLYLYRSIARLSIRLSLSPLCIEERHSLLCV
jgi:hypothetical protein